MWKRNPKESSQARKQNKEKDSTTTSKSEFRPAILSRSISHASLCMVQAKCPSQFKIVSTKLEVSEDIITNEEERAEFQFDDEEIMEFERPFIQNSCHTPNHTSAITPHL